MNLCMVKQVMISMVSVATRDLTMSFMDERATKEAKIGISLIQGVKIFTHASVGSRRSPLHDFLFEFIDMVNASMGTL